MSIVKNLFFLVLSMFQFHSVVPQECETVFYSGVFYSLSLDRCRCLCISDDDIAIQVAELVVVSILGGAEGKCELVDGEDPCTWWSAGDVPDDDFFESILNATNSTEDEDDTNSTRI